MYAFEILTPDEDRVSGTVSISPNFPVSYNNSPSSFFSGYGAFNIKIEDKSNTVVVTTYGDGTPASITTGSVIYFYKIY